MSARKFSLSSMLLIREAKIVLAVKVGLCIVPFLLLYVPSALVFPYITGKVFAFRIAVAITCVLWVGLALQHKKYRPQLTPVFKIITALVAIILLADLLGPNPRHALWSNYEKMDGFITLFHLYLYYVMLAGVFKHERDWTYFLLSMLSASALVTIHALFERAGIMLFVPGSSLRVESITGNTVILAPYILLHLWLPLLLMRTYWHRRKCVAALSIVVFAELLVIYFTATRAVFVALFIAIALLCAMVAILFPRFFPHSKGRRWFVGTLVLLAFAPLLLWQIRATDLVRGNYALNRLTNYESMVDVYSPYATVGTRLMVWQMAWNGVRERPLLGWGQESFYLVFQEYYDPAFFAKKEPWYDRPHNTVLRLLLDAGLVGTSVYGALLVAIFLMLWRGARDERFSPWVALSLAGFFISYVAQGLFSYDTLHTYLPFFALLAYVEFAYSGSRVDVAASTANKPSILIAAALAFVVISLYWTSIRPLQQILTLRDALQISDRFEQSGELSVSEVEDAFARVLAYESFGDSETRGELARVAIVVVEAAHIDVEQKKDFVLFALRELRKEIEGPNKNVKHLMVAAYLLREARFLDASFIAEEEKCLLKAIELSPTKQPIQIDLAGLYINSGRGAAAVKLLENAWKLDPRFSLAARYLIVAGLLEGRLDLVAEVERGMDFERWTAADLSQLGPAHHQAQNFSSALAIYERLVELDPKNAEFHFTRGMLYMHFARYEEAQSSFEEAVHLDPERAETVRRQIDFMEARSPVP
ncbi:MAG: tetratricopeptide (TPR) repeat protein [Candidatus Latescibacterota bacterium]|jgi:tetratricopeptide (TPR) repeat protein